MTRARLIPLVFLTAAMLLFAGCGDDSTKSGSDDAGTKAAAAKEARDAADEQAREAFEKGFMVVGEQLDSVGDDFIAAEDWTDFRAAVKELGTIIASLNALTPPEAVEAEHAQMVKSLRATMLAAKRITETSTEASDAKALAQAESHLEAAAASSDEILTKLG